MIVKIESLPIKRIKKQFDQMCKGKTVWMGVGHNIIRQSVFWQVNEKGDLLMIWCPCAPTKMEFRHEVLDLSDREKAKARINEAIQETAPLCYRMNPELAKPKGF